MPNAMTRVMSNTIYRMELENGNVVKVYPDDSPESPREWSNLGTLECLRHRRYNLGDSQIDGDTLLERLNDPDLIAVPVYAYEHGQIALRAIQGAPSYPFNDQWDSALCGVVFVSKPKVIQEYGDLTDESVNKAIECLKCEVNTYSQYVNGEVYSVVIEDKDGETIDSICGVYADSAEDAAELMAEGKL
jgi:hypothetical protein